MAYMNSASPFRTKLQNPTPTMLLKADQEHHQSYAFKEDRSLLVKSRRSLLSQNNKMQWSSQFALSGSLQSAVRQHKKSGPRNA